MSTYTPAHSIVEWLYNWQSLIGSLLTGLVAVIAIRWAARQFMAADQQAATAAARALRDQLAEDEELLRELDKAQKFYRIIMDDVGTAANVSGQRAAALAARLDRYFWELHDSYQRIRERGGYVRSPAQGGFEAVTFDTISLGHIAVHQLEEIAADRKSPQISNETVSAFEKLYEVFILKSGDLRREMRDDIRKRRKHISRYMQKATQI